MSTERESKPVTVGHSQPVASNAARVAVDPGPSEPPISQPGRTSAARSFEEVSWTVEEGRQEGLQKEA